MVLIVNCNGSDYTTINIPNNSYLVNVHAYRTSANGYHYIKGCGQVVNSTQVFLYYDAENSGDHLVTVSYISV